VPRASFAPPKSQNFGIQDPVIAAIERYRPLCFQLPYEGGKDMKIGDWPATQALNEIFREIRELGLESNLAELEAYGFTILENALTPETTQKLREATLREYERRYKLKINAETGENFQDWQLAPFLLYKDPVFADLVLHRQSLALISYFLGNGAILTGLVSHMKGPGGKGRALHTDNTGMMPAPFAPYEQIASCQFFLTDYTEANGAFAVVPGSHRQARRPTPAESSLAGNDRNSLSIPVEAPAGSAVVFLGKLWHGSYPRTQPGLRMDITAAYVRPYITQIEDYRDTVTPEFLERFGGRESRMAQLVGLNTWHGYRDEGIDDEMYRRSNNFGHSWQG
jgi:ectoine hydroxylase-related dioxygenase (phytanoyl-CoA dioxygenase family)